MPSGLEMLLFLYTFADPVWSLLHLDSLAFCFSTSIDTSTICLCIHGVLGVQNDPGWQPALGRMGFPMSGPRERESCQLRHVIYTRYIRLKTILYTPQPTARYLCVDPNSLQILVHEVVVLGLTFRQLRPRTKPKRRPSLCGAYYPPSGLRIRCPVT
jgi:hypothetical protein